MSKGLAIAELSRSTWYRDDPAEGQVAADQLIIDALNAVVEKHEGWGFWKYFYRLRNLDYPWKHQRVWRVYTEMRLNQKRRTKKRLPERTSSTLDIPAQLTHTWSFDFMSDSLQSERRYRVLNIWDEGIRESLGIFVDSSIIARGVVGTLEQIKVKRGLPSVIPVDSRSEMTFQVFTDWCEAYNIRLPYIQPGKSNQNAYIERFNRPFKDEILDPHLFRNLNQVWEMSWAWRLIYNEERPSRSPVYIPPAELKQILNAE